MTFSAASQGRELVLDLHTHIQGLFVAGGLETHAGIPGSWAQGLPSRLHSACVAITGERARDKRLTVSGPDLTTIVGLQSMRSAASSWSRRTGQRVDKEAMLRGAEGQTRVTPSG
jgi:hypothetical protein